MVVECGLILVGEGTDCWACTIALCGRVGGGSVVLDKGEEVTGWANVDDLVLRGFLAGLAGPAGTFAGGEREGAASRTGESCGERSELMSMMGING